MTRAALAITLAIALLTVSGCDEDPPPDVGVLSAHESASAGNPNRIDIPSGVRQNLGITFARAEYRRVERTMRLPGRFELLPTGRHQLRAPFGGRVQLLVKQYERVDAGQVVARISSPEWHRLQLELEEDEADVTKARAELAIAEQSLVEGVKRVERLQDRVTRLKSAEVRRTELESELAAAQSAIPRLEAEITARQAAFEAAKHHLPLAEQAAAAQLGISRAELLEEVTTDSGKRPRWQAMSLVEVRATDAGIVESLSVSDGGRVDALGMIATTIDPQQLRFRAVALQSDLTRLHDGQLATILAPADPHRAPAAPIPGTLHVSPDADPDERTIDLIIDPSAPAPWCRPGVSGYVEITSSDAEEELAIPLAATIQDGLKRVFFRRDPKNPDVAIRTEADLGTSDWRWIIVQSDS
jgi:hypothetical protein